MNPPRQYFGYIMTNKNKTTLYTGVINDLARRVEEHKNHKVKGFTDRYNLEMLVYYEVSDDIEAAILREKQLNGGSRKKKIALIESINPDWKDLYQDLLE